jgi:hypothetical protein
LTLALDKSSFILKSAADQLAPILTDIFQTSIDTGDVPQDWRDANIVPLFKRFGLFRTFHHLGHLDNLEHLDYLEYLDYLQHFEYLQYF